MVSFFTGHARVRGTLEERLPPVTLLQGPPSVGKWTLAVLLAGHHTEQAVDRREIPRLTVDRARDLKAFCGVAPFGSLKVVVVDLEGAHEGALNALLKLLEEPPPSARFILVSSKPVIPTIVSRAEVHRMGVLSVDDLIRIIVSVSGETGPAAVERARRAEGRADRALEPGAGRDGKAKAAGLLRMASTGDLDQLDAILRRVPAAEAGDVLAAVEVWAREARTGRWSIYGREDVPPLPAQVVVKVLERLGRMVPVRPRLALREVLAVVHESRG